MTPDASRRSDRLRCGIESPRGASPAPRHTVADAGAWGRSGRPRRPDSPDQAVLPPVVIQAGPKPCTGRLTMVSPGVLTAEYRGQHRSRSNRRGVDMLL